MYRPVFHIHVGMLNSGDFGLALDAAGVKQPKGRHQWNPVETRLSSCPRDPQQIRRHRGDKGIRGGDSRQITTGGEFCRLSSVFYLGASLPSKKKIVNWESWIENCVRKKKLFGCWAGIKCKLINFASQLGTEWVSISSKKNAASVMTWLFFKWGYCWKVG